MSKCSSSCAKESKEWTDDVWITALLNEETNLIKEAMKSLIIRQLRVISPANVVLGFNPNCLAQKSEVHLRYKTHQVMVDVSRDGNTIFYESQNETFSTAGKMTVPELLKQQLKFDLAEVLKRVTDSHKRKQLLLKYL